MPLLGLAGQISLAQLSFAGIGAVVMAHHGAGGNPVGVLSAVVVSAAVGALVALPVLRLSGIYLALATAAFAVALDRWIFNLPDFDLGPVHISIFDRGLGRRRAAPDLRLRLRHSRAQLVLANVVFVRRRDGGGGGTHGVASAVASSPSATARPRARRSGSTWSAPGWPCSRFSAGIAGLGGAIYGMQLNSINPTRFDLVVGLPIFMLVVVGGAGLVGGALFAGISLNGLLPLVATLGNTAARWSAMATGLVGIGLGRNPSGAVQEMSEGVLPLRRDRAGARGDVRGDGAVVRTAPARRDRPTGRS